VHNSVVDVGGYVAGFGPAFAACLLSVGFHEAYYEKVGFFSSISSSFLRRGVSVEKWLPVYLGDMFGDVYGGAFGGGLLESFRFHLPYEGRGGF